MATVGIINGTNFRLYVGGLPIGYATSATMDLTAETLEAVHKDAAGSGWADNTVGQLSGTCSFEGFLNVDAGSLYSANTPATIFTLFSNKTKVGCTFQGLTTGDTKYTFQGYVTALSETAPVEDNSTFSGTITITGAVTQTTTT